jgi:hypothetical protein
VDIIFEPAILLTKGFGRGDRDIRHILEEALGLGWESVIRVKNVEEAIIVSTMELTVSAGSRSTAQRAMAQMKLGSTSISQQVVQQHQGWTGRAMERLITGQDIFSRRSKALEEWSRKRLGKESKWGPLFGNLRMRGKILANIWKEKPAERKGVGVDGVVEFALESVIRKWKDSEGPRVGIVYR